MSDVKKCDILSCNNYMEAIYFDVKIYGNVVRKRVEPEDGWVEDKEICTECLKELFGLGWDPIDDTKL